MFRKPVFRLCVAVPCLLWAASAQALSCLPHDVAAIFQEAQASEDRFMAIIGELTFDETRLPKADMDSQQDTPPDTLIPARLSGRSLSRAGFTGDYSADIMLNAQCYGPWCAGAQSGMAYLAFVNLDRDVPEVTINPCGGFGFPQPTKEMEQQVVSCLQGGTCTPRLHR
ncbi:MULTISPECIES: hypothetical protein [unclassified Marinovum]